MTRATKIVTTLPILTLLAGFACGSARADDLDRCLDHVHDMRPADHIGIYAVPPAAPDIYGFKDFSAYWFRDGSGTVRVRTFGTDRATFEFGKCMTEHGQAY